jgi:hypothetical protein
MAITMTPPTAAPMTGVRGKMDPEVVFDVLPDDELEVAEGILDPNPVTAVASNAKRHVSGS